LPNVPLLGHIQHPHWYLLMPMNQHPSQSVILYLDKKFNTTLPHLGAVDVVVIITITTYWVHWGSKGMVVCAGSGSKWFTRVCWVAMGDSKLEGRSLEVAVPRFFCFDWDRQRGLAGGVLTYSRSPPMKQAYSQGLWESSTPMLGELWNSTAHSTVWMILAHCSNDG